MVICADSCTHASIGKHSWKSLEDASNKYISYGDIHSTSQDELSFLKLYICNVPFRLEMAISLANGHISKHRRVDVQL